MKSYLKKKIPHKIRDAARICSLSLVIFKNVEDMNNTVQYLLYYQWQKAPTNFLSEHHYITVKKIISFLPVRLVFDQRDLHPMS